MAEAQKTARVRKLHNGNKNSDLRNCTGACIVSWANYDDALSQVLAAGLVVDHLDVGTAKPVRCYVEGDREKRGWYWLTDIELERDGQRDRYIVGSFGVWRGNDKGAIKLKMPTSSGMPALSSDEKKAIAARHKENARRAAAIRQAEADKAAAKAANAWRQYVSDGASDYLTRKGVGAHGVRFAPSGNGTMAVPMCDAAGRIHGLQIVRGKDRGNKLEKQYWPAGLSKQGHYHLIGAAQPGAVLLLAEGYATAATLYESTGLPVAVAFDANNMMPVAQALAKAYKGARLLVCADDDYLTDGNPGVAAAKAAALAVSGSVCVPVFPADRGGKKLTDFNDLQHFPDGGGHLVRVQVEAAIQAAGWEVVPVRSSCGAPAAGGEGESRPGAVSLLPLDDAVERFIPLDDGTGKYLFDNWTAKIVHKDQMVALLPAGIRWDDVKRHHTWLMRGSYYLDQVGFDPAGDDPDCLLNTWRGWPTKPAEGKCEVLLDLLRYQCSQEHDAKAVYEWVLDWLAYPLQHPGAKMQSAVVVHGPQGTGKSMFFESYARIFGEYAMVLNQGAIEDKFNADWSSRKLFILADEIVARQEMHHLKNQLKALITGEWVRVNPKNLAAYKERNHMNIVFLSNEKEPLKLENDDRRHCVVWTPEKLPAEYYDALGDEIRQGGVAALYYFLMQRDISHFKPWTKPPMTQAKQDLIDLGKESIETFIEDWQVGDLGLPFCPARGSTLYQAYLSWCRDAGERYPRSAKQFANHIGKLRGWQRMHKSIYTDFHFVPPAKRVRVVMPSDDAMQRMSANGWQRDRRKAEDQTETEWITSCVLDFDAAVSGRPSDAEDAAWQ